MKRKATIDPEESLSHFQTELKGAHQEAQDWKTAYMSCKETLDAETTKRKAVEQRLKRVLGLLDQKQQFLDGNEDEIKNLQERLRCTQYDKDEKYKEYAALSELYDRLAKAAPEEAKKAEKKSKTANPVEKLREQVRELKEFKDRCAQYEKKAEDDDEQFDEELNYVRSIANTDLEAVSEDLAAVLYKVSALDKEFDVPGLSQIRTDLTSVSSSISAATGQPVKMPWRDRADGSSIPLAEAMPSRYIPCVNPCKRRRES